MTRLEKLTTGLCLALLTLALSGCGGEKMPALSGAHKTADEVCATADMLNVPDLKTVCDEFAKHKAQAQAVAGCEPVAMPSAE